MELFEGSDVPIEARFLLMLQERLDQLSDKVVHLQRTVTEMAKALPPPSQDVPKYRHKLHCADVAKQAGAAFLRVTLSSAAHVSQLIRVVDAADDVGGYGYFEAPSRTVYEGGDFRDASRDEYEGAESQTVQMLVLFDRTVFPARLGHTICDALGERVARVALAALPGAAVGAGPTHTGDFLFEWYLYHIVAGQDMKAADSITETYLTWYWAGRERVHCLFMGNTPGLDGFRELCDKLENIGGHPGSTVWPLVRLAEP